MWSKNLVTPAVSPATQKLCNASKILQFCYTCTYGTPDAKICEAYFVTHGWAAQNATRLRMETLLARKSNEALTSK